jgi:hypothetical protein
VQDAARAEQFLESRVSRVVEVLRLLLGVGVAEVAEKLIEAVNGRQIFIASPRWFLPNCKVA